MTSSRPNQAADHQMMSDHTSCTAGFQRPREGKPTVLLLRRLRRKTPTAEEAQRIHAPGPGPGSGLPPGLCTAQPGSAGWHCCNGCHRRVPPARACRDYQASSTQGQILPARSKITGYGNTGRRSAHFSFKCPKCSRKNLWPGAKVFAPSQKLGPAEMLQERFARLVSRFSNSNARTLDIE